MATKFTAENHECPSSAKMHSFTHLISLLLLSPVQPSHSQPAHHSPTPTLLSDCQPKLEVYFNFTTVHTPYHRQSMVVGCRADLHDHQSYERLLDEISSLLTCESLPDHSQPNIDTISVSRLHKSDDERTWTFTRACLHFSREMANPRNPSLSPQLTLLQASLKPGMVVFERRSPTQREMRTLMGRIPKPEPVFKQLPHVDLRLPADFFYPFACG